MRKLPVVSGRQCIKMLTRVGFIQRRQVGSHVTLHHPQTRHRVTVPLHKELDRGTLQGILKQAGLSGDEFLKLLK
jgi:predicted RNA binding protein YcfA (HicA-like mRNA interferase family)